MSKNNSKLYELFWENSKFSDITIGEFQKNLEEYAGNEHELPALQYSLSDIVLNKPRDSLFRTMQKRRSLRSFKLKPVSKKQIGSILSAFSSTSKGRLYPSAGATYALEIFCLLNNAEGELNKKIVYYNHDNHSLSLVGELPAWNDYKKLLNIDTADSIPPLIVIFVLFAERTTRKYGERGGRFVLIETGHAIQNFSLRLVQENMGGFEIGGLLDDKVKKLLKLDKTTAHIALGYACGFPK